MKPHNLTESEALLARIRKEVELRKGLHETSAGAGVSAGFVAPQGKEKPFLKKAETALTRAKDKQELSKRWPRFLRPFRRNQEVINQGVIESVQCLTGELERLQKLILALNARYDELFGKHAELLLKDNMQTRVLGARDAALESTLHLIERHLSSSKETAPAGDAKQAESFKEDLNDLQIDAFYLAFEDQFRGSRELIKERLLEYVPHLAALKERLPHATAVDIGCGRGEWLEVLEENGIAAHGVDMNGCMAEQCQSLGLAAERGDGIAYLQSLPTDSQALISGFHIVEHLTFPQLLELFRQTLRVLRPGGIAIFETPNPECLRVSTYTFYTDPTHRNPIPPELLFFIGTHTGFAAVEIERFHPYCEEGVFKGYGDYAGIFLK